MQASAVLPDFEAGAKHLSEWPYGPNFAWHDEKRRPR
jgi:hypothetical protein